MWSGSWDGSVPPDVNNHLCFLVNIQRQIVVLTPFLLLSDLFLVCTLIIVTDESHCCCVICKLDSVI